MSAGTRDSDIEDLHRRLDDAQAVIEALRDGSVDAMVSGAGLVGFAGSERPYRAFFDAMNEGALTLDSAGFVLHCNPRLSAMLRQPLEQLRNRPFQAFVAPGGEAAVDALLACKQAGSAEVSLLDADGGLRPVLLSFTAMEAQEPAMSCVVVTDLTERVAAMAELQDYNRRLTDTQFAMDVVGIGITWADAETGRFTFVNRFNAEFLGYTVEEMLGMSVADIDPEVRACGYAASTREIRAHGHGQFDTELLARDGRRIPVEMTIYFQEGRGAERSRFIAFMADISRRKEQERALRVAKDLAESASRAKSAFLANMSHEIRTPLNGVLGLAQIGYLDSQGHDKARQAFERILVSGRLLLTILNDILDFSKIEAGKLDLESLPFAPARLVDDAIQAVATAAAAKGIGLSGSKADGLPEACIGDPTRISQILLNLLSNAIKFTDAGNVTLKVLRVGDHLAYQVMDTGIGIAPDVMERLFKPFVQADSSTTRRHGGTGLGLAISRRLAELMGGRLSASSSVGAGSCFELRIPLQEVDPARLPADLQWRSGGQRLAGLRVLVAEDNEVNQLVLREFLEREGAQLKVVGDGLEAVRAVRTERDRLNVVLMDVQMPVMDGIEATGLVHGIAPALPVIGQTAYALQDEQARCLAAGMVATVTKPIDIDLLVATILRHVSAPGTAAPAHCAGGPVSGGPGKPIVDWAALHRRYAANPHFIQRLVALCVQTYEHDVLRLRAMAAASDWASVAHLAHTLKGVAGNLASADLQDVAQATMAAARSGDDAATALTLQLADVLERLLDALRSQPAEAPGLSD